MSKYVQTPSGLLINLDLIYEVENTTNANDVTYHYSGGTITDAYGSPIEAQQMMGSVEAAMNSNSNLFVLPKPVPPSITLASLAPASAPALVGSVNGVVTGTGFAAWKVNVAVGGELCPVVNRVSDTTINVIIPPSPTGAALAGQQLDVWYDFDPYGGPTMKTLAAAFSWT